MSNSPARSDRNATSRPSGEISAPSSLPSQFVMYEISALASGFSNVDGDGRRANHAATPTPTVQSTLPAMTAGRQPAGAVVPGVAGCAGVAAGRAVDALPERNSSANVRSRAD